MPYNTSIPGQVNQEELAFIERLAAAVPPGGRVLELGSLFGRSSWAWAKSVDPSVTVYCVDPWKREIWIEKLEQEFGVPFGIDTFHRHTADCINIVALPGYSPIDFEDWNLPLDIYFDDSVHTNPVFRQNLEFWAGHIKPGGVLCGHDYGRDFPDIISEVNALAERLGVTVNVVGAIWMIELPADRPCGTEGLVESPDPYLKSLPLSVNDEDVPPLPSHIGSMMKREELGLLYALAKHHYRGSGEVIDLGPFLGSSTFMLVEGLEANPISRHRPLRVFSFDRFIYEPEKGYDPFLKSTDLPTFSFFPHYMANLGERFRKIFCSPGDLMELRWNQNPVEILFIDAAKTPTLNNHIIQQFFGALQEGHSVVVQQDYFYYGCPWIIAAMEHFADWIAYVGSAPGATAYFQSRAKIPRILIRTPLEIANNPARQVQLLERAAERQEGSNRKIIVDLARAYHLSQNGDHGCASAIVQSINAVAQPDEWRQATEWNLDALRQELKL
ncbi:MAG: class I SAM-dependent methyltransferase [Alphaproteobacteria bacterium]